MREGLAFLLQRIHNYRATLRVLDKCSRDNGGCENCPDLIECRELYDQRCQRWKIPKKELFKRRERDV